jgi:hypothetical protein
MLYHSTAPENLTSIKQTFTLYSAAALAPDRTCIVRAANLPVRFGRHLVSIRDQCALRKHQVRLVGGWLWEDLISEINRRVFFWPGSQNGPNQYGRNFTEAYRKRGHHTITIRVGFRALMEANPRNAPYFCKFNSGAPRMSAGKRSPRGPATFLLHRDWCDPPSGVAEVSFLGKVVLPSSAEVQDTDGRWGPIK